MIVSQRVIVRLGKQVGSSVVLPSIFRTVELVCSREHWPIEGVGIQLLSSDDGVVFGDLSPVHIPAWEDDGTGKHPLSDAVIGFGWGNKVPSHVRFVIVAPRTFDSNVSVRTE